MTNADWLAATGRWIAKWEGQTLYKYRDSNGIPTIGRGYNLQNADAADVFKSLGIDWAAVQAAPISVDGLPQHAVAPCITAAQESALFLTVLPRYVAETSALFPSGDFDTFDDGRRCALVDMGWNMGNGAEGLGGFTNSLSLLTRALAQKRTGHSDAASALYGDAADNLEQSDWYRDHTFKWGDQRAIEDVAVIRTSVWTPPA